LLHALACSLSTPPPLSQLSFSFLLLHPPFQFSFVSLHFTGRQCSPCPEKWLQRGDNCYFFSTKWNTWEEGKSQCITLNSRFLKIESKEELEFILESAQSYNSYWIGLFRSRAGGPWLWDDNSTFITDFLAHGDKLYDDLKSIHSLFLKKIFISYFSTWSKML
uniref:C-type lectin domain-containing protein n=1 Tax=Anolis carolinensis TaxID=28377 RepID=A0A803TVE2_ANOCA